VQRSAPVHLATSGHPFQKDEACCRRGSSFRLASRANDADGAHDLGSHGGLLITKYTLDELSDLARALFLEMLDELGSLDLRLQKLVKTACDYLPDEACRRLAKLPGVGPVIATALVAG
jgi:transposase